MNFPWQTLQPSFQKAGSSKRLRWVAIALICFVIALGAGYAFVAPPADTPSAKIVTISRGMSARDVANELADERIIAHPELLYLLLRISGAGGNISAGSYRFTDPENLLTVFHRITTAAYGLPPVRLTFIEGATVRDIGARVAAALPGVSEADFVREGEPYEGYLFPDTYFFSSSSDATTIIATMRANFYAKMQPLLPDIAASGHSLSAIVTMASLLEKEARTDTDKRIVAGILWNRIARGMPLQVDAVFGYIRGRDTYAPSLADLTVDSPYNTYMHKGLPPGPIDNPGLASLLAALHPIKTDYLYYLTGKDGLMHYATTYAGHQANLRKYL